MPAYIINGRAARAALTPALKEKVGALSRRPLLAIVQVGDRADSTAFIRAKKVFARELGIDERHITIAENVDQQEVIKTILELNADPSIGGIIVQLPLPGHMNSNEIIETIDPGKDVDCLTSVNVRAVAAKSTPIMPATARGIRDLLAFNDIPLKGKTVTVVGRSKLVGTPIAEMCRMEGAEVIIAHSKTPDLPAETKKADIVIVATGRPLLITAEHVRAGQVIIDVGITRTPDSGLVGDVDFHSVENIVAAITPVPGGVGPMTVFALFENLVDLCH